VECVNNIMSLTIVMKYIKHKQIKLNKYCTVYWSSIEKLTNGNGRACFSACII